MKDDAAAIRDGSEANRPAEPSTGSARVEVAIRCSDGSVRSADWTLAEEVPVAIELNSVPIAVMMASPRDLEEMAIGYLVAERQAPAKSITSALVLPTDAGYCVDVAAPGIEPAPVQRHIEGRSGCGLCGMRELTDIEMDLPRGAGGAMRAEHILRGFRGLERRQPLRAANSSVHAAGYVTSGGRLALVREDVGRHTALDKLIGALVVRGLDPASGFAIVTSRCSFELVQKAAIFGFAGLASRSAPTRLAVDMANGARLPLACLCPDGAVTF